jgi:hypothetical protein
LIPGPTPVTWGPPNCQNREQGLEKAIGSGPREAGTGGAGGAGGAEQTSEVLRWVVRYAACCLLSIYDIYVDAVKREQEVALRWH